VTATRPTNAATIRTPEAPPAPAFTPGGPIWRNGDFVRLWLSQVAGALGGGVSKLAMPLLALSLTGSPAEAGLIAAMQTFPFLVVGLFAGVIIDRVDRRRLLVACDIARVASVGSIPLAWAFGALTIPQMYVASFVQGAATALANLAQVSSLPRVVTREQITTAQAFNQASQGIATVVGPALGALIVGLGATTTAGAAYGYAFDTSTYALSVGALLTVATRLQAPRAPDAPGVTLARKVFADIGEAMRYLWRDGDLRGMMAMNFIQRSLLGPLAFAAVVLAQQSLGADTREVGWMLAASGVGGVVAASLAPTLRRHFRTWPLLVAIAFANAAGFALMAAAPGLAIAMAGMAIASGSEALIGIVQVAFRLAAIPDALQGRVNSTYRWVAYTGMTLGTAGAGFMLAEAGPRPTFWTAAAIMLALATTVMLIRSRPASITGATTA
jgi:MFS family permease